MDYIEEQIDNLTGNFETAPYLFIGSGFSRRYLDLEDWQGLLQRFSTSLPRPYEYYRSNNDGDLTLIAQEIAASFNEMVWDSKNEIHTNFIERNKSKLFKKSSALKIAISEYLSEFSLKDVNEIYKIEIETFKKINIEGIITTNWDNLLSELFPEFKKIIGQDELIYSNPYGIGEIFKIHGCLSEPETLVLTNEDYNNFNSRNAYLAAKLVTYFIEHPVIFIGYNISDPNIMEILTSIVKCLGETEVQKLFHKFIFVKRASETEKVSKSIKDICGYQIPITILELHDFTKLYKPLTKLKRKLPIRLLRYFKEQLFEFVHSNDPKDKIAVIDIDAKAELDEIEFAIGIGIHKRLSQKGYESIKIGNIIHDVIYDSENFDPKILIQQTIPDINGFVPIFKYISEIQDFEMDILKKNALKAYKRQDIENFSSSTYKPQFLNHFSHYELDDILKLDDYDKTVKILPFYPFNEEYEIDLLGEFLKKNYQHYCLNGENTTINTHFRKLVCLYDFLKYGIER